MKILHVMASTGIGGAEKHLLDLCRQQRVAGLQVHVALPQMNGALSHALQSQGIEFTTIRKGGRFHPLALWSLHKVIQQVQPDLVHAHMLKSAAMVGHANRRIPCVATAHNMVKHTGPFRHCQHVICVSEMVQDSLCKLGYPRGKTIVVHNAVDTQAFSTARRDEIRQPLHWEAYLVVLCVARLVPAKGQTYAIEALQALIPQLPNIKLILVGEGPEREHLQQQALKSGVMDHLSLLGSRTDVADLLAAADIYLQPSIKEGFCIAFLEAMATGLACIGTQTGAIPTMLESGVNGILIPPASSAAIANAILSIAHDTDRRSAYAQAAKITAQSRFSPAKQVQDTLAVYQRVVKQ